MLTPVAALFVLSRLSHSLTYRPLLTKLVAALLSVSDGAKRRGCLLGVVGECSPRDLAASALCLLAVLANNPAADHAALGAPRFYSHSARFHVLHVCTVTDSAGLLSFSRRSTAQQISNPTADPVAAQSASQDEDESSVVAADEPLVTDTPVLAADASVDLCPPAAHQAARDEIAEALLRFVLACSRVEGYADLQALSTAAWLLKELTESRDAAGASAAALDGKRSGTALSAEHCGQLREAAAAATSALRDLLSGPWGDALAPLLCSQWSLVSRVAQPPALGDEHSAAQILYSSADTARAAASTADEARDASSPTAPCAEHSLLAVRRWIVLHSLCSLFCGEGVLAAPPPLAEPPDGYVCSPSELREGSAAPAMALEGLPSRVAFERGKERHVLLSVAASGVTLPSPSEAAPSCFTANGLWVETAKGRGGAAATSGVVLAVAPAAGAEVRAHASACVRPMCSPRAPRSRTWTRRTASGCTYACGPPWARCSHAPRCRLSRAPRRGHLAGLRRLRSARREGCRMATGRWPLRPRRFASRRLSACASRRSSCARCAEACWTGCELASAGLKASTCQRAPAGPTAGTVLFQPPSRVSRRPQPWTWQTCPTTPCCARCSGGWTA